MILNKSIAVIGAGGLLGRHCVAALISAGAKVLAVDQNQSALLALKQQQGASENLHYLVGDITDLQFVQHIFLAAKSHFSYLDGAVNAAYPKNNHYGRSFEDVDYADFCDNLSSHVGAYFLFMQQAVKYSKEENHPFSLVNISSIYGAMAPRFEVYQDTAMTMPVEYAAIKSSINHLTRYVAKYTAGSLFRVNCLSPGGIYAGQDPIFVQAYKNLCHDKGMLDPEDIIPTLLFLLSNDSKYILGQNITVDDGFSL